MKIMKKILTIFVIILVFHGINHAQSLTVINNVTGCPSFRVTMYAQSPDLNAYSTGCSPRCNEIIANGFTIPGGGTTYYWCDPLDFEAGSSGCGTSSMAIGWASLECGSLSGSIEGSPCTANPWTPCLPGWNWTSAYIDLGCLGTMNNVCLAGSVGNGVCAGSTLTSTGLFSCSGTLNATWTISGTNVTITINP